MKYKHEEIKQERWIPAIVKKEGLRKVARWTKVDHSYLSKIINEKVICTWKMRRRLIKAISQEGLKEKEK